MAAMWETTKVGRLAEAGPRESTGGLESQRVEMERENCQTGPRLHLAGKTGPSARTTTMAFGEDDVRNSVESIWSSILGLEVERGRPAHLSQSQPDLLTGCVQITGAWRGAVTLDCSCELARRAAGIMFGLDPRSVDHEQVQDAIGELTNIIGGNFKSLLPEPCQLSLPAVTEGTAYAFRVIDSRELMRLSFSCQKAPFQITIAQSMRA
jgi:chemotaxis protein CheX